MQRPILTPDKIQYIRENYDNMMLVDMAAHLGASTSTLQRWCTKLGLSKERKKATITQSKTVNKVGQLKSAPVTKIKRLPPDHTNISREQHVERWLNVAI